MASQGACRRARGSSDGKLSELHAAKLQTPVCQLSLQINIMGSCRPGQESEWKEGPSSKLQLYVVQLQIPPAGCLVKKVTCRENGVRKPARTPK